MGHKADAAVNAIRSALNDAASANMPLEDYIEVLEEISDDIDTRISAANADLDAKSVRDDEDEE